MRRRATSYVEGQVIGAVAARLDSATTKPPERYSEATLLDAMTGAHRFASSEQDRAILKSIAGIGTSRTRDTVIKNLLDRGFLEKTKEGKKSILKTTLAARQLLAGLPEVTKSVVLSAKWELALRVVAEGRATASQLGDKIDQTLRELIPGLLTHTNATGNQNASR